MNWYEEHPEWPLVNRFPNADVGIEENIKTTKEAEQVADAGVQKRIDEVRIGLEQNKKSAEDKIK